MELNTEQKYLSWFQASNRSTAFHLACGQGSLETVKLLANHDPSICRITLIDVEGQTPLHKAAANNHVHVVEYLLDQVKVLSFIHILNKVSGPAEDNIV